MSLILYVEDDAVLQADGELVLTAAGHDVLLALDGVEAAAIIRRCGPTLSALVTDIQLPGRLNGWQVAEAGREAIEGLPIVYVTASDEADFRVRGVPRSVMVAKPFEWRQVVQAIATVLARSDQLPLNLVATR